MRRSKVYYTGVFGLLLATVVLYHNSTTGADVSKGNSSVAATRDLGLAVDDSLYSMWRVMDQGTNPVPVLIANAVASDRLRLSSTLLGRINSWINNYANAHSNQMPVTLAEMPDADKTCPVIRQEFTYFPVNASNRIAELIVSTVPRPIKFVTQDGANLYVVALLGNGAVKEFNGPGFGSYAISNNIIRLERGLSTIPTNVIQQLTQP